MTCIHKTYPTESKAVSAWYRLGKKRRAGLNVFQCPKCLGWRILAYDTNRKLIRETREEQAEKTKAMSALRRKALAAFKKTQVRKCPKCGTVLEWFDEEPFAKGKEKDFDYYRCPKCEKIVLWERKPKVAATKFPKGRSITDDAPAPKAQPAQPLLTTGATRKNKFAKRPRRAAVALAKATMSAAHPEWAITPEQREGWTMLTAAATLPKDVPVTGGVILAARKLGPFAKLPRWVQEDIARMGVIFPRTQYGRIPLVEALAWEMPRTKRQIKQKQQPRTIYECLLGRAISRYGDKGRDYANSLVSWLYDYSQRDLRRAEFAPRDRRKPHRVRKHNPAKPNRWRKFTTRSLKVYWRWLLDGLNRTAKHDANLPDSRYDSLDPDRDYLELQN